MGNESDPDRKVYRFSYPSSPAVQTSPDALTVKPCHAVGYVAVAPQPTAADVKPRRRGRGTKPPAPRVMDPQRSDAGLDKRDRKRRRDCIGALPNALLDFRFGATVRKRAQDRLEAIVEQMAGRAEWEIWDALSQVMFDVNYANRLDEAGLHRLGFVRPKESDKEAEE